MPVPATYNLTTIANSTGMMEMFQLVNTNIMRGSFGTILLATIFMITFLSFLFQTNSGMKSIAGASFVSAILSMLLFTLGLVSEPVVIGFFIASALSMFLLFPKD